LLEFDVLLKGDNIKEKFRELNKGKVQGTDSEGFYFRQGSGIDRRI
jgi:hypothetical protein